MCGVGDDGDKKKKRSQDGPENEDIGFTYFKQAENFMRSSNVRILKCAKLVQQRRFCVRHGPPDQGEEDLL